MDTDPDLNDIPTERIPVEELRSHDDHDHVAAVFADRAHAAVAVEELRARGLGSEHLGLAVRGEDRVAFEHDDGPDLGHDTEHGAALATPLGAIAGIALAALVVPGFGVGGILALGAGGALWGAMLGGYGGVAAGSVAWDQHQALESLPLAPGEVMVVVCSHGHADTVDAVFDRHAGRRLHLDA